MNINKQKEATKPSPYQYYDWRCVCDRLAYHRQRLGLTKVEARLLIRWWYGKTFWQLTDAEIIDYGHRLATFK